MTRFLKMILSIVLEKIITAVLGGKREGDE